MRREDGILEDSIVALFPSVPKNKARGKHPKLVEDVTFKGGIHPIFQRLSDISFHSVGTPEKFFHVVPQQDGKRESIYKMVNGFLINITKVASGRTLESFTC